MNELDYIKADRLYNRGTGERRCRCTQALNGAVVAVIQSASPSGETSCQREDRT